MRRYWLYWLLAMVIGAVLLGAEIWLRQTRPGPVPQSGRPEVVWAFETPHAGSILSSPAIVGERIYIGVIRDAGLAPRGVVHALDRGTGTSLWHFDGDSEMLHMYSSPQVVGDRLFIGEGMHANFACKLYCLDVRNGRKLWAFPAAGHIESTAAVHGDRVVFGAGDDGIYCVAADSGKELWHYDRSVHVDSTPAIAQGLVFVGSGISRRLQNSAVVCLDLATGKEVWRTPVDQPVWGAPLVDVDQVYFGFGNARLDRSEPQPRGGVLCASTAGGARQWQRDLPDAVMTRPTIAAGLLIVTCRDGACYALQRETGAVVWRRDLGSAIVTNPTMCDGKLHVIAVAGTVACLDPKSGEVEWTFDVAAHAGVPVQVYSSPAVVHEPDGTHTVYFGAELQTAVGRVPTLYALRNIPRK